MFVATESEVLTRLYAGRDIRWIAENCGWPTRRIHVFASRRGFLFSTDGVPYRPSELTIRELGRLRLSLPPARRSRTRRT